MVMMRVRVRVRVTNNGMSGVEIKPTDNSKGLYSRDGQRCGLSPRFDI